MHWSHMLKHQLNFDCQVYTPLLICTETQIRSESHTSRQIDGSWALRQVVNVSCKYLRFIKTDKLIAILGSDSVAPHTTLRSPKLFAAASIMAEVIPYRPFAF